MSRTLRRAFAVTGAAVLILALPACAKKTASSGAIGTIGVTPGTSPSDFDPGFTGSTDGATDGTTGSPTPTDTATVTVTSTPKANPTVTVTAQPKITIDQFRVTSDGGPACPVAAQPGASFSSPGHDITLEWKVSGNVDRVALSIDDPTFYKTNNGQGTWESDYNRTDSVTLPWSCDSDHTQNHFTTHTYTLSTIGGGPSVAKTITIKTSNDNS